MTMPSDSQLTNELLTIYAREGSVFIKAGEHEHLVLGSIVVAALPDPTGMPGLMHYRWSVNGDLVQAATVLARFLGASPPFAAVVDGLREIFAHGNRISGAQALDGGQMTPPSTQP